MELREQPVGTIQTLQRVAVASLQPVQLGHLARDLGREQEILARIGEIHGVAKCILG